MKQWRGWVPIAVVALAVVAIAMRIAVAVAGGQAVTEETELTAFDLVLMTIAASVGTVGLTLGWARHTTRVRVRRVRELHPNDVVVATSLRADEARVVRDISGAVVEEKPQLACVVLRRDTLSWWIGRKPRLVATISFDEPIQYSRGRYEHFGHQETNLIAEGVIGGRKIRLPLIIVEEKGFWPRRPIDAVLDQLVHQFAATSTSGGRPHWRS
ncbi:hypothetical protein [Agromyces cerinus]|uniref:hypothetical protein n=1 Tax=Agromyces cerinus TaxID=33878 RepID=UPI0011785E6E|nr:hypothetical protein [Agromyces cerinus]